MSINFRKWPTNTPRKKFWDFSFCDQVPIYGHALYYFTREMATPPENTIQAYTTTLKWLQDEEANRRAGNFRRRNISRVLGLFAKVFSAKFGGVAFFGAAKVSNSRESFLPRKFPAIRYHTYQSAVGDKPCQGNKLLNSKFKDPFAVTALDKRQVDRRLLSKKKFHILLGACWQLILCLWTRGSTARCSDFSNISETNFRRKKFLRRGCSKAKISASQKFTVYDITTMQIHTDCDCCVLK